MEGLQQILSDQADVENIAKCQCPLGPWERGREGAAAARSPWCPPPSLPRSRQAVHRAETLGPADRHLCLTSCRPGPRRPRGLDLHCRSMGWGAAGRTRRDKPTAVTPLAGAGERTVAPHPASEPGLRLRLCLLGSAAVDFRALEGPAQNLDVGQSPGLADGQNSPPGRPSELLSRLPRWQVGMRGQPPPRPDPRAVSLRTSRGPETVMPTQAKAARPAQRIHPAKGVSSWLPPLPPPRPPPSFVITQHFMQADWTRLLHRQARVHTRNHTSACRQLRGRVCCACARVALEAKPPSYLNVLLGTDSTKQRASKTQHRRCCRLSHLTPKMCLIFCSSFSFFFFFKRRKLV